MTSAPRTADPRVATLKPGTSQAAMANAMPFTTSRKRPRVSTVIGRVRTTMMGRTTALTSPRTSAEISRISFVLTVIPGTMRVQTARATAVTSQWMRKERIPLPAGMVRLLVQQIGADIGSVGPDDGSRFGINAYPGKEARIVQILDQAQPADDPGRQIHSAGRAVREGQFDGVRLTRLDRNYPRIHDLRQRLDPFGSFTGTQTPPILQQLRPMETTPLHHDCQHPRR